MARPFIKPNEIPDEMMAAIRDQFERQPEVRKLRVQADQYTRQRQYTAAMQTNAAIQELFNRVVTSYIDEAEQQHKKFTIAEAGIPREDVVEIMKRTITLTMAIDIMDSCVLEIDETLHKTDPELSYEMYDDIRECSKMAKQKLAWFARNTSYLDKAYWGDIVDEMYLMMRNKAMKIIKKTDKEILKPKEKEQTDKTK